MLPERDHRLLQREIVGFGLETRCRAVEAIEVVERAVGAQGIPPGALTLGTDNGSAFTARRFRAVLSRLGIAHRRGGYRDPESQAFIESWFAKLKERCVWRHEFETLDQARELLAAYIDRYHDRPTRASATGPPPKSGQPGTMPRSNYKKRPPEVSTPPGSSPKSSLSRARRG